MDIVERLRIQSFVICGEAADEIERLRLDAARYRWLRDGKGDMPMVVIDYGWCEYINCCGGPDLDAAIDAAMKA